MAVMKPMAATTTANTRSVLLVAPMTTATMRKTTAHTARNTPAVA